MNRRVFLFVGGCLSSAIYAQLARILPLHRPHLLRALRGIRSIFPFLAPLLLRLKRGEGGIVILCLLLVVARQPKLHEALLQSFVALSLPLALYSINDLIDRYGDLNNPKKNRLVTFSHLNAPTRFWAFTAAILSSLFLLIGNTSGLEALSGTAGAIAVTASFTYSLLFKRIPVLDVIAVGVCAGATIAVFTSELVIISVTCLLFGLAHLYQAREDLAPDRANSIATIATLPYRLQVALVGGICSLLAGIGMAVSSLSTAFAGVLLFAVFHLFPNTWGWMISRILALVVFCLLLFPDNQRGKPENSIPEVLRGRGTYIAGGETRLVGL